ncbi:MAG TPA: hypothetical protein VIJ51_00530 [Solirubrobacteraceae bacterium]
MTGTDGYERLLDDFGRRLDAAVGRPARRLRPRRAALGGLVVCCVAAAGLVGAGIGGGVRLDVVGRAQAALSPPREVIYLVTSASLRRLGEPSAKEPPAVTRQWSTAAPERWRIATSTGEATVVGPHGSVRGAEQFSYADGTAEYYAVRRNFLDVTTGIRNATATAPLSAGLGTDPVIRLRAMLAARQLHDGGSAVVDGRIVRRLVGELPRGTNPAWPVEYDVDPRSFAPVRVTTRMRTVSPAAPQIGTEILIETVDAYKRLPLNAATAELLRIKPTGTPTVYRHSAGDPASDR